MTSAGFCIIWIFFLSGNEALQGKCYQLAVISLVLRSVFHCLI